MLPHVPAAFVHKGAVVRPLSVRLPAGSAPKFSHVQPIQPDEHGEMGGSGGGGGIYWLLHLARKKASCRALDRHMALSGGSPRRCARRR